MYRPNRYIENLRVKIFFWKKWNRKKRTVKMTRSDFFDFLKKVKKNYFFQSSSD